MNSDNNLGYFDNLDYENNLSTSFSDLNLNTNVDKGGPGLLKIFVW